jgi:hypothetical protein
MTDHRHTLSSFLRTDWLRLEAALEEKTWTEPVAARLTDHLRYGRLVQGVYLERLHPHDVKLREQVAAIAPGTLEEALAIARERTHELIAAIQLARDSLLDAPVPDPHDRGFTVLGHLYDYARANAMLVEWARTVGGK